MCEEKGSSKSPFEWVGKTGSSGLVLEHLDRLKRARRRRYEVLAGVLAIVFLSSTVSWFLFQSSGTMENAIPESHVIVTAPQSLVLSDGTNVSFQEGVAVETDYTADYRKVRLSSGEAHFEVAKDADRPFIVIAGTLEVRAIGTAFSVNVGSRDVAVLITEGVVALDRNSTSGSGTDRVTLAIARAGQRIRASADIRAPMDAIETQIEDVSREQIEQELAWQMPMIEFSSTPLADAIEVFSNHSGQAIVLGETRMGQLRLSGRVRAGNLVSLLQMLEISFGLEAVETSDGTIRLVYGD